MAKSRRRRGLFITFEGLDGCGKSTQLDLFARYLERLRLPYVSTREPGGTDIGEGIRKILLPRASAGMDARTEVLLYFAARAQNVAEIILPALERGRIVLSDRFTDASLAYQGHGRRLPLDFIRTLHRVACHGLVPNLTFVVDINPRTSVQRARERNTGARHDEGRIELEKLDFHSRVRRAYLAMARRESRRVKLVSGAQSIDAIHQEIVSRARPLLSRWRRSRKQ